MSYLQNLVGELAAAIPGATRLFRQSKIDFCCGGDQTLEQALRAKHVEAGPFTDALERLAANRTAGTDWLTAPFAQLIEHVVRAFHQKHRQQLPELAALARKVEQVHAKHSLCPRGLTDLLTRLHWELESHMQKEERVLFPLILRGAGTLAANPVAVMRHEHDQHGLALAELRAAAHDLTLPEDACNTWRACYRGLQQLIDDLMEHIHLENNVLFSRALDQAQSAALNLASGRSPQ